MIPPILGSRPLSLRLSWHLPPAFRTDVIALQSRDFSGPLSGHQDQSERRIELRPQQADLSIGEDTLPVLGRITIDQCARIGGKKFLTNGPTKDRRGRS